MRIACNLLIELQLIRANPTVKVDVGSTCSGCSKPHP
jgi:hypothetical protein